MELMQSCLWIVIDFIKYYLELLGEPVVIKCQEYYWYFSSIRSFKSELGTIITTSDLLSVPSYIICPFRIWSENGFKTEWGHSTEPFISGYPPSAKYVMSMGAGTVGREETLSSTEAGTLSNGNSDTIIPECTSLCLIIGH